MIGEDPLALFVERAEPPQQLADSWGRAAWVNLDDLASEALARLRVVAAVDET